MFGAINMRRAARPAVFLDRDGVLNRTFLRGSVTHPPQTLEEFELLPGVEEATRKLAEAGLPLVVVTNQPDVARGIQSRAVVEEMNDVLRRTLPVLDVVACYHDSGDHCSCRKPRPGMLLGAAQRWGLDLSRSTMIGDRWSDIEAGQAAGCLSLLVVTPQSGIERCRPDHCVTSLAEAAEWILTVSYRGHP
jgi:D-glycero-D-manno-heptose 1,7-bisphosphate phosphatase